MFLLEITVSMTMTQIIILNIPLLLRKGKGSFNGYSSYLSHPAVNLYLLLSIWNGIVPDYERYQHGRKSYIKKNNCRTTPIC